MNSKFFIQASVLIGFIAMSNNSFSQERWYNTEQSNQGKNLFAQNCASCHGANAESVPNWKEPNDKGQYPAPPLDGSAHAWHHDLASLRNTIREGGLKLGGQMPPFNSTLNAKQIDQILSFVQSYWSDEIYTKWSSRFNVKPIIKTSSNKISLAKLPEEENVLKYITGRLPANVLNSIEKTEADDVWQIKLQDKYLYLVDGGKYALIGDLIDLRDGRNISKIAKQKSAKILLDQINNKDTIIYPAMGEEKALLTVFTDTSCPFCKKFHKEVPELQKAGISIRYLPYPRGGKKGPGYQTLKSVWCSKDRKAALSDTKNDLTIGVENTNCEQASVVDKSYQFGNQIGVTGTPALFKGNGEVIEGYVPYKTLIPMVLGEN